MNAPGATTLCDAAREAGSTGIRESAARSVTWSDAGTEGCPSRDASPSVALSDAATDSPNREDARSAATHSVFRIIGRIGGTGWSDRARSAEPSRFVSTPLSDPALGSRVQKAVAYLQVAAVTGALAMLESSRPRCIGILALSVATFIGSCVEERCGVDDLGWIGDAFCNSVEDPEYDTAQCAFDGGDC